jgi:hypothetical protein
MSCCLEGDDLLVGLKFNDTKTGSACVAGTVHPELLAGDIRWGFLKFNSNKMRFFIDQDNVNTHISSSSAASLQLRGRSLGGPILITST